MSRLRAPKSRATTTLRERLLRQARRPFVRDTGVLQVGTLATLGTSFGLSILLARTLGPQQYGVYALVVSAMTTISLFKRLGQDYIATTRLAAAYARQDRAEATRALAAFNAINLWSTLLVIPLALLLAPLIAERFFGSDTLAEPLRLSLLPPIWAMALATVALVLQCSRRVGALALLENSSSLALAAVGLLVVLLGGGVAGFFWGQAAVSLAVALIAVLIYRQLQVRDTLIPTLGTLLSEIARLKRQVGREFRAGLAVALDKNLVSLYPLLPILLLGAMAATEDVALLRIGMSYLAVPLLALGAVSRVLMVKLPELHATQPARVRGFFLRVTGTGGLASIVLTLPFLVLAPWLIGLLYGAEFTPAAGLVPLLVLDPLLAGFGIAAGPIFRTYHRNSWAVYANLAVLAIGLPAAYLLIQTYELRGAALAYACLVTALRAVAYVLCLRIVGSAGTEG
jgi:O-antigen/teichoic acid export membrane protein